MRTENSVKNSSTAFIGNLLAYLIAFIAQAIFIKILGTEYLGLNGLFSNVLSTLSIFELGIGNAIVFNLYKPIEFNDNEKIKSLMNFYKKAYIIIALLIAFFGILLLPFINVFIGDNSLNINFYFVYILSLLSTIVSYLMVYKRNLIIANQKNYIINIIHVLYLILLNISQVIILYKTKNYYLYLVIKILYQLLENFVINIVANKMFPLLLEKKIYKLDKKTEKDIFSKVKALIYHKIGGILVIGTDNIIISMIFGLNTVGIYTNYNTITTAVSGLFSQIISTTASSVGNLLVENNYQKNFSVFKKMRFLNFWIASFTSICIFLLIQPFITLWIGEQYLLEFYIIIFIIINFYQKMMRNVYGTFKDSAGIWMEDKYIPIIESILNIAFSIILGYSIGLAGVFMGTIISGLALWCYSYPKFVYKKLFNKSYKDYAKETIGYIVLFLTLASGTYYISTLFIFDNVWLQLISNSLIALIIPNIVLIFIFRKTDNFKYFIDLIKKIINKVYNKLHKKHSR